MKSFNVPEKVFILRGLAVIGIIITLLLIYTSFAAVNVLKDKDITDAIEMDIWCDSLVSGKHIDVITKKGLVTLTGDVDHLLIKDRAQKIAEATIGVQSVINRMSVIPPSDRPDSDLLQSIQNALAFNSVTDAYTVEVRVNDGVVILTGAVSSFDEKALCEEVVKGIKGVRKIENLVRLVYDSSSSDVEIKKEIETRMMNDIRVDDYQVLIEVKDGTVTLSGSVGSLQEKKQTIKNAWVEGVSYIDADHLYIKWRTREAMRRENLYANRTDSTIKQAVQNTFRYDPYLRPLNFDIQVSEGIVTLNGIVSSLRAKQAAEENARHTTGVWDVENHLKIQQPEILSDETLNTYIDATLLNDPYIGNYDIYFNAHMGWVNLNGQVNNAFEKDRIQHVVEGIKYVVGVVNNIKYKRVWLWQSDKKIESNILTQVLWNPFIDSEDIQVSVVNGNATLTGTVTTWAERHEATKNAYQGGAKDILNKLKVTSRSYGPTSPIYFHFYYQAL